MIINDPISDMLTRIRNAILSGSRTLSLPHSKNKANLLKVLKDNKYIVDYKVVDGKPQKSIDVIIAEEDSPITITEMKRESKPGRRMYVKAQDIPKVKNGRGITVVSTSQGLITGEEARSRGVGGELICSVY